LGNPRLAVYPGTFDPITNGHTDLVTRAAPLFDRVVVAVADSSSKGPGFSMGERITLARMALADLPNVEVRGFDCLLASFVEDIGAGVIIRGLRAVSDFEYEFQMAGMNNRLNPNIETVFLMASDKYQFISSRFVKEIGQLGGDVSHFVSVRVAKRLQTRFGIPAKNNAKSGVSKP
jgi:pantetheine-phosphate adenylyltransferase